MALLQVRMKRSVASIGENAKLPTSTTFVDVLTKRILAPAQILHVQNVAKNVSSIFLVICFFASPEAKADFFIFSQKSQLTIIKKHKYFAKI
jgi:hypothetical protein